jgi:hypothetical protein
LTKLDDLRDFVRNKHNKQIDKEESARKNLAEKEEEFSLEVAGTTDNPLASFGDSETDPDIVEQLYSSPRNRVLPREGASYWNQDLSNTLLLP